MFSEHKTVIASTCSVKYMRQIRRSVPTATFQTLVVALVLSRLDYGKLVFLHAHLVRRLQSVQNTAARLIYGILILYSCY